MSGCRRVSELHLVELDSILDLEIADTVRLRYDLRLSVDQRDNFMTDGQRCENSRQQVLDSHDAEHTEHEGLVRRDNVRHGHRPVINGIPDIILDERVANCPGETREADNQAEEEATSDARGDCRLLCL